MEKGKYGLSYQAYIVMALILALIGQTLLCFVVFGVVLLGEKHEKTARQLLEIALFSILVPMVAIVLHLLSILTMFVLPFLSFLPIGLVGMAGIAALVVEVLALIKAIQGEEISLPLVSKFVGWAFGPLVKQTEDQPAPVSEVKALPGPSAETENKNAAADQDLRD